jgi:hypothetical protein
MGAGFCVLNAGRDPRKLVRVMELWTYAYLG